MPGFKDDKPRSLLVILIGVVIVFASVISGRFEGPLGGLLLVTTAVLALYVGYRLDLIYRCSSEEFERVWRENARLEGEALDLAERIEELEGKIESSAT